MVSIVDRKHFLIISVTIVLLHSTQAGAGLSPPSPPSAFPTHFSLQDFPTAASTASLNCSSIPTPHYKSTLSEHKHFNNTLVVLKVALMRQFIKKLPFPNFLCQNSHSKASRPLNVKIFFYNFTSHSYQLYLNLP